MILYKVEYYLKKQKDRDSVIYIRTRINGKLDRKSTGITCEKKYWDQKGQKVRDTHPNHEQTNIDLAARRQNIINPIVAAQIAGQETVNINLKPKQKNVFLFVEDYIKNVKREKSSKDNQRKHLRKLKLFIDPSLKKEEIEKAAPDLTFEQIDADFLTRYENYVRGAGTAKRKENSTYITAIWRTLRTWFNEAVKKGVTKNYPFTDYENPNDQADPREYLNLKELAKFEEHCQGDKRLSGLYFLMGCYSGLRVSDWFLYSRAKNVDGNIIRLQAKKNGGWVVMDMSGPLKRIIQAIGDRKIIVKHEQTINEHIAYICKEAKIKKHITSHCGRKTFAVTICANRGISSETCAELMGITIKTCVDSYYKVDSIKINRETRAAWRGL